MPLYEHECACGCLFEVQVPMDKREEIQQCPECSSWDTKRLCGNAGFQLKGRCWSRDGYARFVGDDPRWKSGTFRGDRE